MAINEKGFTVPDGAAADAVILQNRRTPDGLLDTHILLVKRKKWPYQDHWAFPGGFLNPMEDFYDACKREAMEEVHVDISNYCDEIPLCVRSGEYLMDPRGWIIAVPFLVMLPTDMEFKVHADDDAAEAKWFTLYDILEERVVRMAFDHYDVIDDHVPQHLKGWL